MDPQPHAGQLIFRGVSEIRGKRQHEEQERAEHEHVAIPLEIARPAHGEQRDDISGDAEHRPDRLIVPWRVRCRLGSSVEPVDHHEADAVQHEHHRQSGDHGDEAQRVRGQLVVGAEGGQNVGEKDDDDSHEQQAELAPAPLFDPRCDCEGLHDFTVASGV